MTSRVALTLVSLLALAILLGLGTWQVQRLAWKNALSAKIETRLKQAPVSLDVVMDREARGDDIAYTPVQLTGTLEFNKSRSVYALSGGRAGWHLYTPMRMSGGIYVLVNRGFVPDFAVASTIALSEPNTAPTQLVGLVRIPPKKPSIFTPDAEQGWGRYYWRDYVSMSASFVRDAGTQVAPFFVDEIETVETRKREWPRPGTTRVKLSNRHLSYAITWYGLALALVGVYGFFVFGGKREPDQ